LREFDRNENDVNATLVTVTDARVAGFIEDMNSEINQNDFEML